MRQSITFEGSPALISLLAVFVEWLTAQPFPDRVLRSIMQPGSAEIPGAPVSGGGPGVSWPFPDERDTPPAPPAAEPPAPPAAEPPAPPAAEPPAPPAATVPPVPGVELDVNGLPWDARIHSEGKKKIADGSWRQKRNVDGTIMAAVIAELRGKGFAEPAKTSGPGVPVPPPSAASAPHSAAQINTSTPTASAGAALTASPSSGGRASLAPVSNYPSLMLAVSKGYSLPSELLTPDEVSEALKVFGLKALADMSKPEHAPLIGAFAAHLGFPVA